jgi:UDP-N-acetylmuramoyl-tripeptide--D-alanyl-D-alanine ligase
MKFSIQEIIDATQGVLLRGDPSLQISSFSTDSRTLQKGDFFICLSGPHFDGHEFIDDILRKEASGVLLQKTKWNAEKWKNTSAVFVGVEDPLRALGDLAHVWREQFKIPLVAITGSNGKTTTKDMTAAILSESYKTLATEGNLNNLIGVPKMLFRLDSEYRAAVIEMGMNDFGEIDRLTEITEPTVGLITNVAYAHLEKLKNIEGVAQAKGELFARLPPGAVALVNQDDPLVASLPTRAYKISFGIENPADVFCQKYQLTEKGIEFEIRFRGKKYSFQSPVFGKANVRNAVAAVAVGFALGIDSKLIQKALKKFQGRAMRMELIPLKEEILLLNDCYNANPSSTQAALETLAHLKNKNAGLAILGEMLEMGDFAAEGHRRVGRAVTQNKIGYLVAVGEHAQDLVEAAEKEGMSKERCWAASSQEEIRVLLLEWVRKGKTILVKGSRGAQMEKVTEYIKSLFGT